MIIFTEPIRGTSCNSFHIFQDSEDDTKQDIRAINHQYVIRTIQEHFKREHSGTCTKAVKLNRRSKIL